MSSSYTRNTELQNVKSKDLYNLAVILDDDNYWQTLIEIIPKHINNETFGTPEDLEKISSGASYERKYNNDHIRLIEYAIRRPGESRLCSQILFDEWSTSGRKHERPTLGVLLHLLVQSKLLRAADFVAELLGEPKPLRPNKGPAAEFEFKIDVFKDIEETLNDTRYYPNTEDLQGNANIDINKDYYTKYHHNVNKKMPSLNDNTEEETMLIAPKPPPRLLKAARLLKQQQQQDMLQQQQQLDQALLRETANEIITNSVTPNNKEYIQQYHQQNSQSNNEIVSLVLPSASTNYIPKLSALMNAINSDEITTTNWVENDNLFPKPSALVNNSINDDDCSSNSDNRHSQQHSDLNSIPVVVLSKTLNIGQYDNNDELLHDLPAISTLNINGERNDSEVLSQSSNLVSLTQSAASLNLSAEKRNRIDETANNSVDSDLNIPSLMVNTIYDERFSRHHLESIEEDYAGIEHEQRDHDVDLEDDEDSIPNLSFLENRSSNNESSLTSVTNTSGDNSFEQSVNDCSSTSTDNVLV